ncbi:hypothetical protein EYC98_02585 [Halieaceae bacterium IMCC14734]|uniref:Uncharacterized protein n=1 Tax=Candidatus Litorirhabdus singularis TaxID=2518993 RepID=A0ABT3TBS3_9GAMM|nr:hypothetical protein [Candidatus Litorirhabdus singularis]MCX2979746.1 hypothetical protein [Candidatus Litorirhabdus singularis]
MKMTVEDCLALDANLLAKDGWFRCSTRGNITWTNGNSISLSYRKPHLHLSYTSGGEPMRQTIHVVAAPCHYGGVRHYFTCPSCQNRRYRLRLGASGFYCRHCYRLPYYSQQCGDLDGLIHQKHKVAAKLEDSDRPPIRTATRMRLINQLCAADDKINKAFAERFGPQTARQFGFY